MADFQDQYGRLTNLQRPPTSARLADVSSVVSTKVDCIGSATALVALQSCLPIKQAPCQSPAQDRFAFFAQTLSALLAGSLPVGDLHLARHRGSAWVDVRSRLPSEASRVVHPATSVRVRPQEARHGAESNCGHTRSRGGSRRENHALTTIYKPSCFDTPSRGQLSTGI